MNPVSCEPCRQKKCKCDKTLPSCGQCASDPSACRYVESKKRGVPVGYLSRLEERLIETELALFESLSRLEVIDAGSANACPTGSTSRDVHVHRLARQDRSIRMAQWEHYPLRDSRKRLVWLRGKAEEYATIDRDAVGEPAPFNPHEDDRTSAETQSLPLGDPLTADHDVVVTDRNETQIIQSAAVEVPTNFDTQPGSREQYTHVESLPSPWNKTNHQEHLQSQSPFHHQEMRTEMATSPVANVSFSSDAYVTEGHSAWDERIDAEAGPQKAKYLSSLKRNTYF